MTLEENPFWEPVVEDSSEDDLSSLGDFSDDNKFVLDDSTLAPSWKVMPSWKVTPSKINFSESEMQKIVKKSPSCVDASLAVALVFLGEKLKTVSEKTPVELVFGDSLFGSKFIKDILLILFLLTLNFYQNLQKIQNKVFPKLCKSRAT